MLTVDERRSLVNLMDSAYAEVLRHVAHLDGVAKNAGQEPVRELAPLAERIAWHRHNWDLRRFEVVCTAQVTRTHTMTLRAVDATHAIELVKNTPEPDDDEWTTDNDERGYAAKEA